MDDEARRKAASQTLEDLLVESIPDAIRLASPRGKYDALMVCFCGADIGSAYPGHLVLAPASVRDHFLEKHGDNLVARIYYIWSPDEFPGTPHSDEVIELHWCPPLGTHDPVSDISDVLHRPPPEHMAEELTANCPTDRASAELLNLCKLEDGSIDALGLIAPLRRAARRLNDLEWASIIDVTDDFVVVAVDNCVEYEVMENVVESLSEAHVESLRARGLLWNDPPGFQWP